MTDREIEPFVNDPEPTTFKMRIRLDLDSSLTLNDIANKTAEALHEEFGVNIHVWKVEYKTGNSMSTISASIKAFTTREGMSGVEDRTKEAISDLSIVDGNVGKVVCVDTLP